VSNYWEGVKQRWRSMTGNPPKRRGTGTGHTGTGSGGSGTGGTPGKEWELIHQKFRQIMGRDPYSFQELVDWWNQA